MADFLVVGAGAAGAACAEELRVLEPGARIVLVSRELDPPYDRPPLSKGYLAGSVSREELLLHPPGHWEELGVDLRLRTSVMKLDPAARVAVLQGGEEVAFDAACLATGAMVRRLRVDGAQLEGIHYLRTPGNADAIRREAAGAERVVLAGGSFVACEVAATLASLGKRCTLVMQEDLPLSVGCGSTAGRFVGELMSRNGVEWLARDAVARFEGAGERVERVLTQSGRVLEADLVVMGTGAVPDVMLARASGIELGETGGIRCSGALETSAPGVFAAGDACQFDSVLQGAPARIEHWEVASAQGRCAARGMTGSPTAYDEVPYFWCDLADWATLEYVSVGAAWDAEEVRGSVADGEFSVIFRAGERVVAALTVGRPDDLDEARELMRAASSFDTPTRSG